MFLNTYSSADFSRGASFLKEMAWIMLSGVLVTSWFPGSRWRVTLMRLFGARIGQSVVMKPGVKVKFPWRLVVGDYSWIGEDVWIDNLATVSIGSHACISQSAYLCTGSHDWSIRSFELIVKPISIGDRAWIGAHSKIAPGTLVGEGAVVQMGAVANGILSPWHIYSGSPIRKVSQRKLI